MNEEKDPRRGAEVSLPGLGVSPKTPLHIFIHLRVCPAHSYSIAELLAGGVEDEAAPGADVQSHQPERRPAVVTIAPI
jgi:hypothetical protein